MCAISFPIYCDFIWILMNKIFITMRSFNLSFFTFFCLSTIIFLLWNMIFFVCATFFHIHSFLLCVQFLSLCVFAYVITSFYPIIIFYSSILFYDMINLSLSPSIYQSINSIPAYLFEILSMFPYITVLLSIFLSFCQFLFSFLVGCLWPARLSSKYLDTFYSQYHLSNIDSYHLNNVDS